MKDLIDRLLPHMNDSGDRRALARRAGWGGGEPVIEYRFSFLEEDDIGENVGGIEKWWIEDGDTLAIGEFHVFGEYVDEAEFKQDVQRILAEAKQHAEEENLDAFLAVIDIVKNRIYDMDEDDESVFYAGAGTLASPPG